MLSVSHLPKRLEKNWLTRWRRLPAGAGFGGGGASCAVAFACTAGVESAAGLVSVTDAVVCAGAAFTGFFFTATG